MSDPRERFTGRVDDYVRYRPGYPPALLNAVLEAFGPDARISAADIGSGTGIFTRMLIERGVRVYAVEPNRAMRTAAEAALTGCENFTSIDGSAERSGLHDASVDLVTAAQAFHWFDPEASRAEFARILRPHGRLALIWNQRRVDQPFQQEYDALLRGHAPEYDRVNHMNLGIDVIGAMFRRGRMQSEEFDNVQRLDFRGLLGRLQSSSYCPPAGSSAFASLADGLRRLFEHHADDGHIEFSYDSRLYLGPVAR